MRTLFLHCRLYLWVLCLLMALGLGAARPERLQAQVTVAAQLDYNDIRIGEQAHLRATVTSTDPTLHFRFPEFKRGEELTEGVEVLAQTPVDTAQMGDCLQLSREYTLTSFDSALYLLPVFTVWADTVPYQAAVDLALKVSTVEVDTVHIDQFYGPHAVVPLTFEWRSELLWWAVLALALFGSAVWLSMRLSNPLPLTRRIVIPPKTPPHTVAIAKIQSIKSDIRHEDEETVKAYYDALTDILCEYIEERFGFNAREMTSAQIIDRLQAVGDTASFSLRELREVLSTADLVKFAKYRASLSENDRTLLAAADFVNATKIEQLAPEPPKVIEVTLDTKRQRRLRAMMGIGVAMGVLASALLTVYIVNELYDIYI